MYERVIIVVFRKTAATKLNPHSSRSHSIVLMKVFCQEVYVIMLLIEVQTTDLSASWVWSLKKRNSELWSGYWFFDFSQAVVNIKLLVWRTRKIEYRATIACEFHNFLGFEGFFILHKVWHLSSHLLFFGGGGTVTRGPHSFRGLLEFFFHRKRVARI